jgi:two-component system, OmpR family, sensor kinase
MSEPFKTPRLSFHQQLMVSITTTILLFGVLITLFQHQREKNFRVQLLTEQLLSYNNLVHEEIKGHGFSDSIMMGLMSYLDVKDLRITVIDFSGKVLMDSEADHLSNHGDRPEIKEALATGQGSSVRRKSETIGKPFFYAATRYENYIVRCSRPYDSQLNQQLRTDNSFLFFTILLLLIMLAYIFRMTERMGRTIRQLRDFAQNAEQGDPLDTTQPFPHNELGDISRHIVGLFQRLHKAKNDLVSEREKLYTHLQTAREGLAVFGPDKKDIVANNLFIQHSNTISDSPIQSAQSIFDLPELAAINQFIERNLQIKSRLQHLQRHEIQVEKNGKIFLVQCVIFEDNSFEISLIDITHTEEESRLKRQLTQNIAHELKTPISSIQGYLETILENPDLPDEKRNKFVERSYLQSKRLSDLLRDISTLTRMDDAPRLIEKEPVNIASLLRQMAGDIESDLKHKHIHLVLDLPDNLVVNGNPSLLYSIFRNLMDNALAYGGEGIEIGVHCFRQDTDRSYFIFYDTGEGIPDEHLNRIFERFYRVDKGRTRKLGGTGLGLAIVKNAVQLHGGTIAAKNRQGGGLEVIFSLSN